MQRRAVIVYLLAILLPAGVLLYLGLDSIRKQKEAVDSLVISNLRLSGEKLAAELERRTRQSAADCLSDPAIGPAVAEQAGARTLERARRLRASLDAVRQKHPVVKFFFVLEGGSLVYPLVRTPPPRGMDSYLAAENRQASLQWAGLFRNAEELELKVHRAGEAQAVYRQCFDIATLPERKALALSRVARCLRSTGQAKAAAQAYGELASRYGDLYDPSNRPYGLVAALETGRHAALWDDLTRGRWELSAEQLDYFLERTAGPEAAAQTEFAGHLLFARAVEERFRHSGLLRPNEIYASSFASEGTDYRIYYLQPVSPTSGPLLAGFSVDRTWLDTSLLPRCRAELGLPVSAQPWERGDPAPETPLSDARTPLAIYAGLTMLLMCSLLLGVLLLFRDISRESRLNQLREEFVSGVSHELKTPLTVIRLYADTLADPTGFNEQEKGEFCSVISRECERLGNLVDKVLTFSRIEHGEKKYHFEEGNLAEAIRPIAYRYAQFLGRSGFSVELEMAEDCAQARFDADAVSQAVVNLLDNAVKYAGREKYIAVRLRAEPEKVVFEVEDHGIGIAREEHEKVFHRFYRIPNASAKGGHGLGLYLVRHIMNAHGGVVELASEPGKGSRFRLVFPAWRKNDG